MTLLLTTLILILVGIILEVSLLPLLSIAGANISLIALALSSLVLLGFLDLAFAVAVLGGVLLDLLSPPPFGIHTVILAIIWAVLTLSYRYRLVAPQVVGVAASSAVVGALIYLPHFWGHYDWIGLLASIAYHILVGTLLFPLFVLLFPRQEVVKL